MQLHSWNIASILKQFVANFQQSKNKQKPIYASLFINYAKHISNLHNINNKI